MQDVASPKLSFSINLHQLKAFTQAIHNTMEPGTQRAHIDVYLRAPERRAPDAASASNANPAHPNEVNRGAWALVPAPAPAVIPPPPPPPRSADATPFDMAAYRAALAQYGGPIRMPPSSAKANLDCCTSEQLAEFQQLAEVIRAKTKVAARLPWGSVEAICELRELDRIFKEVLEGPRCQNASIRQALKSAHLSILEKLIHQMSSAQQT
jgi:hypothetical protein